MIACAVMSQLAGLIARVGGQQNAPCCRSSNFCSLGWKQRVSGVGDQDMGGVLSRRVTTQNPDRADLASRRIISLRAWSDAARRYRLAGLQTTFR